MSGVQQFEQPGMNTCFTLRLRGVEAGRAASTAASFIAELERLESLLSFYRPDSDVARINSLAANETLHISPECHECLLLAAHAHAATGGLFDATQGARYEHRKRRSEGPEPAVAGQLAIDPGRPVVTCIEPGRQVDFGGIGKGFALEKLRLILAEAGVRDALVSAGASTHLALDGGPWRLQCGPQDSGETFELRGGALSVSGSSIQGEHVLGPPGEPPVQATHRIWIAHPNAALADAYSTAALLMTPDERRAFRQAEPEIQLLRVEEV